MTTCDKQFLTHLPRLCQWQPVPLRRSPRTDASNCAVSTRPFSRTCMGEGLGLGFSTNSNLRGRRNIQVFDAAERPFGCTSSLCGKENWHLVLRGMRNALKVQAVMSHNAARHETMMAFGARIDREIEQRCAPASELGTVDTNANNGRQS